MVRKRPDCSNRKPHFFKVLLGDFHLRLRIPPAFVQHISKETSSSETEATLEGPSGSIWHVQLSTRMNHIFLQDGWPQFALAHFLREYDFLVFRYNGGLHFTVRIFDKTGCEREEGFTAEVCEEPSFFPNQKEKQGQSPKKSLNYGRLISQHKDCEIELKNHQGKHVLSPNREALPSGLDKHGFYDVDTHIIPSLKQGVVNIENKDLDFPVQETGLHSKNLSYLLKKRRSLKSDEKARLQETANSFTSKFPFFATHIGPNQVDGGFVVYIPLHFAKSHLQEARAKIVLQDPKGKAWDVKYVRNYSSHNGGIISGGWAAFARGNNLKGDICILELVGKLEMHVHIFPSVKAIGQHQG